MTESQNNAGHGQDDLGGAQPTVAQPTVAQPTVAQPPTASWTTAAPASRAPIRWGGVVWGLILTAFAAVTLYVLASDDRAAAVGSWLTSLNAGSAWALGAAVVGLIIVVSALLGGIRASQRRRLRPRV